MQLFESLEPRINSSATPLTPFAAAPQIPHNSGPFVQAAIAAPIQATIAAPVQASIAMPPTTVMPTPSLDISSLLRNRAAAIDPRPALSYILDAWSIVHYDLPVWSGLPTSAQIHQGNIGDCYLIADLQAMADQNPVKLMQSIKIYSDGTYGVIFHHVWSTTEIRVDGNFGSQQATPTDALWGVIIEKAYAAFRLGQNTYASIASGAADNFSWDMGWTVSGIVVQDSPSDFAALAQNAFDSHWALTIGTPATPRDDAPLIGSHAYEVVSVSGSTADDFTVTFRNPWGIDGTYQDSNPWDGLVTLNWEQVQANIYSFSATY